MCHPYAAPQYTVKAFLCLLAIFCSANWSADALELRWQTDFASSARSVPAAVDINGDARQEVLFTTRFDGVLHVLDAVGTSQLELHRPNWLGGSAAIANASRSPAAAFQESGGAVTAIDLATGSQISIDLPGMPALGSFPCFADLRAAGRQDIVVARNNGILTALDRSLTVLWQYAASKPFETSPVAGPVFADGAGVYAVDAEGVVHCVHGLGRPVWTYAMAHRPPHLPALGDLLIVLLPSIGVSVLASDREGWLYALDAATGKERWRVRAGTAPLGSPAIADIPQQHGFEIISTSSLGEITAVDEAGAVLARHNLPAGDYVPRPLVADLEADGTPELIVARRDWRIVLASLEGAVKEEIPLQGSAREGLVLSDTDSDGFLELIAATDCGRAYCFSTRAREGWVHPRGSVSLNGCAGTIGPISRAPEWTGPARLPRNVSVNLPVFNRDAPLSTVSIVFPQSRQHRRVSAVVRDGGRILGSCAQPLDSDAINLPLPRTAAVPLNLDLVVRDGEGHIQTRCFGVEIAPLAGIPVPLPPREELAQALADRIGAFRVPATWAVPSVANRSSWNVVTYAPSQWEQFGLAERPFIRDAALRVQAPATSAQTLFRPGHPAWDAIAQSPLPFFLENEYFRPTVGYSQDAYSDIIHMAGSRFLGFQVHEWAYRVWKDQLEGSTNPPASIEEATRIMRRDFEILRARCQGRIYAGEGYCLAAHQAYAWGAPMCYAEIGENIPCAPLAFSWIRGAARQWGGKPWGAYLSNWYRGAVLDTRFTAGAPRLRWNAPEDASGPDCGHSASLEYRMAIAAHLAGATFIHHESDLFHGSIFATETAPGAFSLSEHGDAFERAYSFAQKTADRGVPYTPIALLVDFDHGWRPGQPVYGIWEQGRPEKSMEAVFGHVFDWKGRLDFESGYLTNGSYGDIFDVLTNGKRIDAINNYAVLWPVGNLKLASDDRRTIVQFVEQGGVLVIDSALATQLPETLTGVVFSEQAAFATGVQTPLGLTAPVTAPLRFHPMRLARKSHPFAWSESGEPIGVWNTSGQGLVIVSATEHWLDESQALSPIVPALLRALTDAALPVSWSGDVQALVDRTASGWLIGLINNNGVSKVPTASVTVSPEAAQVCYVSCRGKAPLRFESRLGEFSWDPSARSLATTIPPGGAAVIELTTE